MSGPRVIIEADGGSRGNPGPAGYGAVVFDRDRQRALAERCEYLGVATNNVAEYRGLIAGLMAARELGAGAVDVRMDSKLVVEQMSGRWKVKHPDMIPLNRQAADLARSFDEVTWTWIPRAENSHADRLANEAMDDAQSPADASDAGAGEDSDVEPAASCSDATPAAPGWMATSGTPTCFLLLRHGQTPLSVERRYSGRGNPELTDLGQTQAAQSAKRFAARGGVAAVITSPLARTRATADAAAHALGLPVQVHEGLIETDFGEWEGLTFSEAAARDPQLHQQWLSDTSVRPPGGESFDEVRARVLTARDELSEQFGGANLLVVSHVTPIKTMLQLALDGGPSLLYRLHLDLASLSIAEFYDEGRGSVRLVNDTSHLTS
ncbi:MAG: bifunctional RNase H/acid phosphatase [Rhodococcus sp.]|nr:bifunctional RNase H/acid phosphatase [Rhodococcus sp. (in: high G+C Gram-positive bacteria)]